MSSANAFKCWSAGEKHELAVSSDMMVSELQVRAHNRVSDALSKLVKTQAGFSRPRAAASRASSVCVQRLAADTVFDAADGLPSERLLIYRGKPLPHDSSTSLGACEIRHGAELRLMRGMKSSSEP